MNQENHIILTDEEQDKFDVWTKMQVYEAYLSERLARMRLNVELNKVNRLLAEIKFKATK